MRRWFVVPFLVLAMGFGAYFGATSHGQQVNKSSAPAFLPRETNSYRDIVKQVLPAVVSVESRAKPIAAKQTRKQPRGLPFDDPRVPGDLRRFFEDFETPDPTPQRGFGSGFFIDSSGVLLTNAHVVEGADQVVVTLQDGRKLTSKDIKADSKTDVAIVTLDSKSGPYPYLEMGDSDAYEVGDRVLAVGAPFGLTGTVTQGIISAKNRHDFRMNTYEDFIQTDAAINPGNSGGPLIGLDGKVVGINAAIKSRSGGFQGVGLAVASNLAKNIVQVLRTDGVVHRGYLGVQIRELQPEVAQRFGLSKGAGVLVGEVFEKTPAEKAGMQSGDIITSVAGTPIKDGRSLQMTIANLPVKKATQVEVLREGKKVNLAVTLEEQPKDFGQADVPAPRRPQQQGENTKLEKLGVEVTELTKDQSEELGFRKAVSGVLITNVTANTPAAEAGLRKGMVISKVDSQRVNSVEDARHALQNANLQRGVLVMVQSPTGGTNFVLLREGE